VVTATLGGPGDLIASVGGFSWYRFNLDQPEILASGIDGLTVASIQVSSTDGRPEIKPGRYLLMLIQADPAPDGTVDKDLVPAQGLLGVMPVSGDSVIFVCPDGNGTLQSVGTVPISSMKKWASESVVAKGDP
jgi:hypothetical protein